MPSLRSLSPFLLSLVLCASSALADESHLRFRQAGERDGVLETAVSHFRWAPTAAPEEDKEDTYAGIAALTAGMSDDPLMAEMAESLKQVQASLAAMKEAEAAEAEEAAASALQGSEGVEVVLYGVIHLGDKGYYQQVLADLDSYDAVLFEGVKDTGEGGDKDKDLASLMEMYEVLSKAGGLSMQGEIVRHDRPNRVHADMTSAQLQEALDGSPLIDPSFRKLLPLMPLIKGIAKMGGAYLSMNKKRRRELKVQFAQGLASPSEGENDDAIILKRNEVVLRVLRDELKKHDQGKIAIFYGAAHMEDLSQHLQSAGFTQSEKRWQPAWTIGDGVPADKAQNGALQVLQPVVGAE